MDAGTTISLVAGSTKHPTAAMPSTREGAERRSASDSQTANGPMSRRLYAPVRRTVPAARGSDAGSSNGTGEVCCRAGHRVALLVQLRDPT